MGGRQKGLAVATSWVRSRALQTRGTQGNLCAGRQVQTATKRVVGSNPRDDGGRLVGWRAAACPLPFRRPLRAGAESGNGQDFCIGWRFLPGRQACAIEPECAARMTACTIGRPLPGHAPAWPGLLHWVTVVRPASLAPYGASRRGKAPATYRGHRDAGKKVPLPCRAAKS